MGDTVDSIAVSYSNIGWDISQFPVIVGTDGIPRDGRTRIRAAIKRGEKFIPCALFSYDNSVSVRQNSTNGLLANRKLPYVPTKWEDFVSTGVAIIRSGEMKCDLKDIENWLYNEADVTYSYSNAGGNITKIAKQIYERASRGGDLLILRSRDDWKNWIEKSIQKYPIEYQQNFSVRNIDDLVFYESAGSRADHVLCKHILPNASKGIITNIIIYSANDDSEKTKNNHYDFSHQLDEYYNMMYDWINKELSGIKLMRPHTPKLWRIIGVIPQLRTEEHKKMLKNHILAKMSDFKPGSTLSGVLGLDEYDDAA